MYPTPEYIEAIRLERYARIARTSPPARMTGRRSTERVIRLLGRGREQASESRAA